MNAELLQALRCPASRQSLRQMTKEELNVLNESAKQAKVKSIDGVAIESELSEALIREDQKIAYPIINGIPSLLVSSGIAL
ncbi:MAG: hypothetical protein CMO80_05965 [Verrucomicrobiales bacterium]|nr:hypothetical protein [Verrucomicrobiales bacterium]|tara:strand:- start:1843 stop:2085 length:243 start_codon:yes stop_codon:yes gene_type:complete